MTVWHKASDMGRLKTAAPRIATVGRRISSPIGQAPGYGAGRGGRAWRRLRWSVLVRDCFTCQACGRVFPPDRLDCDHIIPLANGGTDDMANLQSLCNGLDGCHGRKTAADMGHRKRQAIGADGWPVEH